MIEVSPLKDKEKIKALFSENGVEYSEISGAVVASCRGETLGYCLYELTDKTIKILKINPMKEDIMLSDGILRSALHVAAERSAMDAFYSAELEELCAKLGFIKEKSERRLDIDKLFGGCCC